MFGAASASSSADRSCVRLVLDVRAAGQPLIGAGLVDTELVSDRLAGVEPAHLRDAEAEHQQVGDLAPDRLQVDERWRQRPKPQPGQDPPDHAGPRRAVFTPCVYGFADFADQETEFFRYVGRVESASELIAPGCGL